MNIKAIKNHIRTMDMISEEINKGYRKHFAEQNKTVEEKIKESGIDYQIDGDHILIGSALEDYDKVKEMELERALEDEAEQNRYMEEREIEGIDYGEPFNQ